MTPKVRHVALEVRPKVLQAKCQMTTKSPKRNCKDCKLGLIDCEKHMQTCGNCAFSACNFCMRFCCERGDCARKICCAGVAKHQAEIHVGECEQCEAYHCCSLRGCFYYV